MLRCTIIGFSAEVLLYFVHLSVSLRLATSRPLGEQREPCLAAKRQTASDPTKDFWKVYASLYVLFRGQDLVGILCVPTEFRYLGTCQLYF